MNQKVDVICQNCKDGSIIPIKVRLEDEDGQIQQFCIKSYKEVAPFTEEYTMPNEVTVKTGRTQRKFECKVTVLDRERRFYLILNTHDLTWMLRVIS